LYIFIALLLPYCQLIGLATHSTSRKEAIGGGHERLERPLAQLLVLCGQRLETLALLIALRRELRDQRLQLRDLPVEPLVFFVFFVFFVCAGAEQRRDLHGAPRPEPLALGQLALGQLPLAQARGLVPQGFCAAGMPERRLEGQNGRGPVASG
jgi:hypothetical protein